MFRKKQLRGLLGFLTEHEAEIMKALQADLGKPEFGCRHRYKDSCFARYQELLSNKIFRIPATTKIAGWVQ